MYEFILILFLRLYQFGEDASEYDYAPLTGPSSAINDHSIDSADDSDKDEVAPPPRRASNRLAEIIASDVSSVEESDNEVDEGSGVVTSGTPSTYTFEFRLVTYSYTGNTRLPPHSSYRSIGKIRVSSHYYFVSRH